MKKSFWDDVEKEINDSTQHSSNNKKSNKQKARKWREIEKFKEDYQLAKELLSYDEYIY